MMFVIGNGQPIKTRSSKKDLMGVTLIYPPSTSNSLSKILPCYSTPHSNLLQADLPCGLLCI